MKTQLIIIENFNIIVSDEKINDLRNHKGKWHLEKGSIVNQFPDYLTDLEDCQLIIASTNPDHNLPSIDYNGLEEKYSIVDVKKLAKEYVYNIDDTYKKGKSYYGFKAGFKTAQSLNNKKFSLEDIYSAMDFQREVNRQMFEYGTTALSRENFIKSLQQPKVFDVVIEMLSDNPYDPRSKTGSFERGDIDAPKITNNKIKILK